MTLLMMVSITLNWEEMVFYPDVMKMTCNVAANLSNESIMFTYSILFWQHLFFLLSLSYITHVAKKLPNHKSKEWNFQIKILKIHKLMKLSIRCYQNKRRKMNKATLNSDPINSKICFTWRQLMILIRVSKKSIFKEQSPNPNKLKRVKLSNCI